MKIGICLEKAGAPIFRCAYDAERKEQVADFAKLALEEFHKRHPDLLFDDDVTLKWVSLGDDDFWPLQGGDDAWP
jgi:hypothetical protein